MTRQPSLRLAFLIFFLLHAIALGFQIMRDEARFENPLGMRVERLASGRVESLASIASGRPLLVVFFTTWCEYCVTELERGADLAERLSTGSAPVAVVFINVREHDSVVASHPAVRSVAGLIGLDRTGELARAFEIRGYPSHVLLGSDGELLWGEEGLCESIELEVARRVGGGGNG